MARRTKEEALETRHLILDSAERVFARRGVSRASLNEIAGDAGLSRGAIYWHFKDKAELFQAMMERVLLPMEEHLNIGRPVDPAVALGQLRQACIDGLRKIVDDDQVRRVFEIAVHKVEYVDELEAVRDRRRDACKGHLAHIEGTLAQAIRRGELGRHIAPRPAALGLHSLLEGLFQNWMLDQGAFDLVKTGTEVIDCYLDGLARPRESVAVAVADEAGA
jgi:TetR/AcrR family transcriptional regulator, acrAB operon repressor